jgi:orotidine-5'-phosphate decarboxylase
MNAVERLIFALDFPEIAMTRIHAEALRGHVGAFKVGLELFSAEGPGILRDPVLCQVPILLDLKLHDIPETVRRTMLKFKDFPIMGITVHASGGLEMLKAAVSTEIPVYAVTVLTSIDQDNLDDEGIEITPKNLVLNRADIAKTAGCAGIIASPLEVEAIRKNISSSTEIVTPGIRSSGKDAADQKRTSTPHAAFSKGATRIVVGRPIRDAENPVQAADRIVEEIELGLGEKS